MDKVRAAMMSGPIPGQSLTDEPGAFPWEQPPALNDPEDVLDYYINKIADPEVSDNVLAMMDMGMPISVITDSMLSMGVMEGIHTVDSKLIAKPKVGAIMKRMAEEAGIKYKESMDDYLDKDAIAANRRKKMLVSKLAIKSKQKLDKGDMLQQQVAEDIMEQPPVEEEKPTAKGLMAKE